MHPFKFRLEQNYDTQNSLFHYTSVETARDFILPTSTLRFSRQETLNDPKESKNRHFYGTGSKDLDLNRITNLIVEYLTQNVKVCCFSRDDPNVTPTGKFPLDLYAMGHMKPRMWASYGDQHKGVCLVFDKKKLTTAFERQRHQHENLLYREVSYDHSLTQEVHDAYSVNYNDFATDFHNAMNNQIEHHSKTLFFFKHFDWLTEFEYRFVIIGGRRQDEYLAYGNALVGIALGMETEKVKADSIVPIANAQGIPVVQLPDQALTGWSIRALNEPAKRLLSPN